MLIDAHIHIGRENSAWVVRPYREIFSEYLRRGIGGVRDGGDVHRRGLEARRAAEEIGIIFKTPVYAFVKKGGYGNFLGTELDGKDEIKEEFRRFLTVKPDHMKVICSGIMSYDEYGLMTAGGFSYEELEYIVGLSHDKGLQVMAHCCGTDNLEKALKAGADSIEHGYFLTDDQLYQMKEQGTIWVPTLAPFINTMKSDAAAPAQKIELKKYIVSQSKKIEKAFNIGVKLAAGSDAGPTYVEHGQALLDEIRYLADAGIPRQKVLELCEKNGRVLLGM